MYGHDDRTDNVALGTLYRDLGYLIAPPRRPFNRANNEIAQRSIENAVPLAFVDARQRRASSIIDLNIQLAEHRLQDISQAIVTPSFSR